jgi:regulator of nucleoside diphosphate kinase
MEQREIRLTDVDSRRLQSLIEGSKLGDVRDVGSAELLEQHLHEADVWPATHIESDVVTMDSEVLVTDTGSGETFSFQVVFPRSADAGEGRISVLEPLGMAVLGRSVGDRIHWDIPGGRRTLRVEDVIYQPERSVRDDD